MPGVADVPTLAATVTQFPVDGLVLEVDPDAAEAVRTSLAGGRLLLGEVHGVQENPQIVAALIRMFGIGGLALELPPSVARSLTDWRRGGPVPEAEPLWWGDGRVTAGHLALLRHRPDLPMAFVDAERLPDGRSWADRDASLAKAVQRLPEVPGGWLVVAGNLHTSMTVTELGPSMGYLLADAFPTLRSIGISYRSGRFYNATSVAFPGPGNETPPSPARLSYRDGELVLTLPLAHEAVVPHRPHRVPSVTDEELAAVEQRESAASGVRWELADDAVAVTFNDGRKEPLRLVRGYTQAEQADLAFAAHARDDVIRLTGHLRGTQPLVLAEIIAIAARVQAAWPGETEGEPDLTLWFGDRLAPDADVEFVVHARRDIPILLRAAVARLAERAGVQR